MDLDPTLCRQAMLARNARFDGRFFTAVHTTGIYCRPICPARPSKIWRPWRAYTTMHLWMTA